jgi:hypothetical protein
MKISNKVVAALGLAGTMFAGVALAGSETLSDAEQLQPYPEMSSGSIQRRQCPKDEVVQAFSPDGYAVTNLAEANRVKFACLKVIDGRVVYSSVQEAYNKSGTGFRKAGPTELGQASYFIFAAK